MNGWTHYLGDKIEFDVSSEGLLPYSIYPTSSEVAQMLTHLL